MSTQGFNIRRDVQELRDNFFSEGMKEYYSELMQDKNEFKEAVMFLRSLTAKCTTEGQIVDTLYRYARALIAQIELGMVKEKNLDTKEKEIAHCLYWIEDLHKVLVLEKTYDGDGLAR